MGSSYVARGWPSRSGARVATSGGLSLMIWLNRSFALPVPVMLNDERTILSTKQAPWYTDLRELAWRTRYDGGSFQQTPTAWNPAMAKRFILVAFIWLIATSSSNAQFLKARKGDWPWWRGPSGNGIAAAGQKPPVSWSESNNIVWKNAVPGRGHASPTVVGNRIFLCTADDKELTQSILCYDRKTGKRLWAKLINKGAFPGRINRKNTHASPSVASDGKKIYATFLNNDRLQAVALDFNGKKVWEHDCGLFKPNQYKNGYASSPFLYGKLVIVAGDFDGKGYLTAVNQETGKEVWKTNRPARVNYASPVVAPVNGRHQLLISGCDMVAGYDPLTGKQIWKSSATTMATAGTMVWHKNLVFASGGYPDAETACVKADGSGEVVWRNNQKCYEQSLISYKGYIYAMTDRGIVFCWNAMTGKEQWRKRLQGPISASPVVANDNLYITNERGTTWVIKTNPKQYQLVAKNQLGTDAFASIAICGSQIYMRVAKRVGGERQETLYCIGK